MRNAEFVICGNERLADLHPGTLVRPPVAELIQRQIGSWSEKSWICTQDLQKFRHEYVRSLLEAEKGEITALDQEVLERINEQGWNLRDENFPQLSPFSRFRYRIMSVTGRIQLENGKKGWKRSGMADVASRYFCAECKQSGQKNGLSVWRALRYNADG